MLSTLHFVQLLVDVGLVVLILLVQLIIYPSFLFYDRSALIKWHHIYTKRIAIIVAPLMITQLVLVIYILLNNLVVNIYNITISLIIIAIWGVTFAIFVPLHSKISSNSYVTKDLHKLVSFNWIRVLLWIFILILNLYFNT